MFDSFLKKSGGAGRKDAPQPAGDAVTDAKQEALAEAERLTEENAAAEFILQCGYSDARLKAAQLVQSAPLLQKVVQAMRNTDRRVAKLMQQRLDLIAHHEAERQRAAACIERAQRLSAETLLTPNMVADLDRAWQQVIDRPADLSLQFDEMRATLGRRLEAQAALQRAALDLRKRQQRTAEQLAGATTGLAPEELAQAIDELERDVLARIADPESQALPRNLIAELEQEQARLRAALAALEQRQAAVHAREAALAEWEAARTDGTLASDGIAQAWAALPPLHEADRTQFDARFAALTRGNEAAAASPAPPAQGSAELGRPGKPRLGDDAAARKADEQGRQRLSALLAELEKSLQEGALHAAAEHDRELRALEGGRLRPSHGQAAQLARVRAELKRLQGWARWGGNISREELTKAAEELPAESLAVTELAKKVGSLRERWKALDISAGPASKEAWLRFDAACTAAYAPVAEHAKKLAEERRQHFAQAEALIAQAEKTATLLVGAVAGHDSAASASSDPADPADLGAAVQTDRPAGIGQPEGVDWRAVASECARLEQQWKRLGPMDRKARKSADHRFAAAMRSMTAPLAERQKQEMAAREQLVAEAAALEPADRHALDKVRRLQERWQQRAKAMPLEHHDEQAVWKRFRAACDALFARRKAAAKSADAQRMEHLHEREALCAGMEAAASGPVDSMGKVMRESRDAWGRMGPAPRADERRIETRFQAALAALQKRLDDAQRAAGAARADAVRAKLALCRAAEERIAAGTEFSEAAAAQAASDWGKLPASPPEFEHALRGRFDAAAAAWKDASPAYAADLERRRPEALEMLLRLEILAGIDSPPALARERLKLQVEVLRSSLKSGQKAPGPQSIAQRLAQLCGLPARLDAEDAGRLDRIIARLRPGN